ncbi:hypothetical protein HMPREF3038_01497 [Akkermansia sp. KLE1797]|nr:hypothetical protein HMPREF3038_01497 [Akkermansia sp. KLE1797]KXU53464.1 hypothetical protein HMPREF3039_02370 [Akkermansia sp. KLE1798]KZA04570.1 hypothetical protein HMPREF1326_01757 [Akkermansia sp. KLE1605]
MFYLRRIILPPLPLHADIQPRAFGRCSAGSIYPLGKKREMRYTGLSQHHE